MRKTLTYIILMLLTTAVVQAQLLPKLGSQRAGISALTFLKIDPSPRSAAMASAHVSMAGDAYAAYWNPAALADVETFSLAAANTFWVAGINHAYFSAIKPTKIGKFALSITSLSTGAMERRTEFQPNGTGEKFYASNTAVGLSYSKRLTDFFSYGITLKYINETLAEFTAHTGVVDMGFLYRTDFKDLSFAVVLQSFGTNSKLSGEYTPDSPNPSQIQLESYPAPTLFKLGVSMIPWKTETMSLTTMLQLNHPNDNAENIRIGLEYEYRDLLFIRAGYKINVSDQVYPTAGLGLRTRIGKHRLVFDYGVDPTPYLGWIHRIGLSFSINKTEREPANDAPATE
ncbi:MAG TPA: PorV/PorQ family protein [Bacteroidetes bacterium]|nr:PorV/PorQ family protein [Bacteroidota bacterium]